MEDKGFRLIWGSVKAHNGVLAFILELLAQPFDNEEVHVLIFRWDTSDYHFECILNFDLAEAHDFNGSFEARDGEMSLSCNFVDVVGVGEVNHDTYF